MCLLRAPGSSVRCGCAFIGAPITMRTTSTISAAPRGIHCPAKMGERSDRARAEVAVARANRTAAGTALRKPDPPMTPPAHAIMTSVARIHGTRAASQPRDVDPDRVRITLALIPWVDVFSLGFHLNHQPSGRDK